MLTLDDELPSTLLLVLEFLEGLAVVLPSALLLVLEFLEGLVSLSAVLVLEFLEGLAVVLPSALLLVFESVLFFELLLGPELFEKLLFDLRAGLSVLSRAVLLFLEEREFLLVEEGFFTVSGFNK